MKVSDWLQNQSSEVMVTKIVTLKPTEPLAQAASVFLDNQISGAPVVDDDGKCIGVLSVTDVIGAAEKVADRQAKIADQFFGKSDLILPVSVYEEELAGVRDKLTPAAEQPVQNFMVTNLVTVAESDPIEKVIRSFVNAHVHRVIVTSPEGHLRGIIGTLDVLASLLRTPV